MIKLTQVSVCICVFIYYYCAVNAPFQVSCIFLINTNKSFQLRLLYYTTKHSSFGIKGHWYLSEDTCFSLSLQTFSHIYCEKLVLRWFDVVVLNFTKMYEKIDKSRNINTHGLTCNTQCVNKWRMILVWILSDTCPCVNIYYRGGNCSFWKFVSFCAQRVINNFL